MQHFLVFEQHLSCMGWTFLTVPVEHKDDGEKSRNDKKIPGLSRHKKTTSYSPTWDDVRIIYRENNWKKRKLKEIARIRSHNKKQLMNKKMWKKGNLQFTEHIFKR